ncbi:hypothetical protein ACYCFK_05395 [Stutzerimonas stutzeri]
MQTEQQDLEQQLAFDAFRVFTVGRIAPHLLERDGLRFAHLTVQLVFEAFCAGRARTVGQQLYASIKESSKYHSQNAWGIQQGYGHPFPVRFQAVSDAYVIKGGPGGQYRLEDVELYVMHTGEPHRVF